MTQPQATPPDATPKPSECQITPSKRYHDLDALRAFAMLLGIVLHGLLSFAGIPIWPAQDIYQNPQGYGFIQHLIHGFRMPLFFLLSGFFTMMLLQKRGRGQLIKHRLKRIVLPMVVGLIVVWPLMIGVGIYGGWIQTQAFQSDTSENNLWTAARAGDLAAIDQSLDAGTEINAQDGDGVTALNWATLEGQIDAVRHLIEKGAQVSTPSRDGSTPLHSACFLGRSAIAEVLLAHGADPEARNLRGEKAADSLNAPWKVTAFILGILKIDADQSAVLIGREEIAVLLSVDTREGEPQGDRPILEQLIGLWMLGALFPFFHHLWFLYYLCLLFVLFLIFASLYRRLRWRIPETLLASPWCWTLLVPLTFLAQLLNMQTFGPDTASGLLPWPPKLLYYSVFFFYGAYCFQRPFFESQVGQHWAKLFLLALPTLLLALHFFTMRGENFVLYHSLSSLLGAIYAWLMTFGMIGLFRRFFSKESPRIRYLSDSSYWLYLAHLPLIIALQVFVSLWPWPSIFKFTLICLATFGILLVLYEFTVRYTWIGTMLNGKKVRQAKG